MIGPNQPLSLPMDSRTAPASDVEIDVRALLSSLIRTLPYLIGFIVIVSVSTIAILGQIEPRYRSDASILIETGESALTRTTAAGPEQTTAILDQEAISSQVQLIRSRDLAVTVSKELDLASLPEFDPALRPTSFVVGVLRAVGLARKPSALTAEERVLRSYYDKLAAYAVEGSRVIAVAFTSTDPKLAAAAANAIAEAYIAFQREAKRDSNADAAEWLSAQIVDLRARVQEAEARVEAFRSGNNLFTSGGQTPATLPQQQLIDLSAELSRVRAARADAETRAAQIRAGLDAGAVPNITAVLNSQLIQRLVEQQVGLRAEIAQLSATLLPQHPRMKELSAQLADLDRQIAIEARKILESVEAEAKLASAREREIENDLGGLKTTAARANDAEVDLRALEREAAAQRDLLDSYLRRYREALAREGSDYQPADARIISRAAVSIEPDFPKMVPMTAAATVAALILAIAFVLLRELTSGRPMRSVAFAPPGMGERPPPAASRWTDGASVHRIAAGDPTLVPELVDHVEESLRVIADDIVRQGAKRIMVTLAEGSDSAGRPLAAVALARVLARTDARVILVDVRGDGADQTSMGEADDVPGFADLFDSAASFSQVIFRDRKSRVHFIAAGRRLPPAAGLDPDKVETILSALTLTYDYVIVDVADAAIATFGATARVAVVVSEHDADDRRTIDAFERVTAASDARILLLTVDGPPPGEPAEESAAAEATAPAGEAA